MLSNVAADDVTERVSPAEEQRQRWTTFGYIFLLRYQHYINAILIILMVLYLCKLPVRPIGSNFELVNVNNYLMMLFTYTVDNHRMSRYIS